MDNQQQTVCTGILILSLAIGLYFIVPKVNTVITNYKDVQTKTQQVENTRKQIQDLKVKRQAYVNSERKSTKPVYKNNLETTDEMSSFGIMFEDVIQSAKYNGLKLRSIAYDTAPAKDMVFNNMNTEYNVCAISMKLIGTYSQLNSYFQDLYNYPYLMNLDKIDIKPYEKNKKILIADVTVNLYSEKTEKQKVAARAAESVKKDQKGKVDVTEAMIPGM